ncbi:MAG: TetR/AcrR family transcriptional regulator [Desulfovibrionaceae bacterium]|nr:TetR/AcrR family transcriptional regulator [Desulfovibrionaceae bacterium]
MGAQAAPDRETMMQELRNRNGQFVWEASEKAYVVLQAARKVFFEHGYFAATTDMIQREAGVSKSTLYQHYRNKEGMLSAVIVWTCTNHSLQASLEAITGETLRERLICAARLYLDLLLQSETVSLLRVIVEVSRQFPDLNALFFDSGPGCAQRVVEDILERAAQAGEIALSPAGIAQASTLFKSMVRAEHYFEYLLFPGRRLAAGELDAWAALAVDSFLAAFGKGHSAGH